LLTFALCLALQFYYIIPAKYLVGLSPLALQLLNGIFTSKEQYPDMFPAPPPPAFSGSYLHEILFQNR